MDLRVTGEEWDKARTGETEEEARMKLLEHLRIMEGKWREGRLPICLLLKRGSFKEKRVQYAEHRLHFLLQNFLVFLDIQWLCFVNLFCRKSRKRLLLHWMWSRLLFCLTLGRGWRWTCSPDDGREAANVAEDPSLITGWLEEVKLRRLDNTFIECQPLSEDFPLNINKEREGKRSLENFIRPTT